MLYDFYMFMEQFGDLGWCILMVLEFVGAGVVGYLARPMIEDIVWFIHDRKEKKVKK